MKTQLTSNQFFPIIGWVDKICGVCSITYYVQPCRASLSKFCSKACLAKSWERTPETKAKIGRATAGPRLASRAEKNYNWSGGNFQFWKKIVRERDLETCQCKADCAFHKGKPCGFSDPFIMHVDHIQPKRLRPDLATNPDNLTTLCPNCHQYKTNHERRARIFNVGKKNYAKS